MEELILLGNRAVSQINNIMLCVYHLFNNIFRIQNGFGRMLVDTILGNEYLLISLSLVLIGFVIGLLKRLINL